MFKFHMPTKLFVGSNCLRENKSQLILGKRAMIVTGKTSGARSGALDEVIEILKRENIPYLVYDKIENNPEINDMARAGLVASEFSADFLIGIGGGSPLDATKAIAVYSQNPPSVTGEFKLYDIFTGEYPNKPLPMVAIPTTAGTGSETTPYSILTLHKEQNKRSFSSPDTFFKVAFLDGKYTLNLPLQIARNTAVDAMCHLLEGYTNKKSSDGSDYIALEGLKIIGKHLDRLRSGEMNTEACTELLWASTLGGIVISQTGTTVVHSMGYMLTYHKDIPHGMANGFLLYEYLKRQAEACQKKKNAYLKALGIDTLEELKNYLEEILPFEMEINKDTIEEWSKTSIMAKNVASCPFPITREDEINMYTRSLFR